MNKTLEVSEKYSRYWPAISLVSGMLAVLFFAGYQYQSDVLVEGYLRLISFAFFALSLLSLYKVKEGKIDFKFSRDQDDLVSITYRVNGKVVFGEAIDLKEIEEWTTDEMPNRSLYNDFARKDRCIKFRKKESNHWTYFNMIDGRVIPFTGKHAQSIIRFMSVSVRN